MESTLHHDFARVRVHADSAAGVSARDVGALAYTVGPHVVFAAGMYEPHADSGRGLLLHELAHVIQQEGQPWSLDRLAVSRPGDPDELEAERVAGGAPRASHGRRQPVLNRKWEASSSSHCADRRSDTWLEKVVVDQEKAQSVTLHWSDGATAASICSTGKGHCCIDERTPDGTAASVEESRRNGSNATPIGADRVITDTFEIYNGWKFWNTFHRSRGIALHQHHTVTGTPLSHGCVRLPEETARSIFCGARQNQTRVEVRGFARPDCAEPELRREWESDFRSAAATVTDGERPDRARIIRKNREETRRMLGEAYGRTLSEEQIAEGTRGELAIPRCSYRGAEPGVEAGRSIPATGAAANVPSASSELLAASGLERFVPAVIRALDGARSAAAARTAVERLGRGLWAAASAAARGGRRDDRPLYWGRVQALRAIAQWQPRFRISDAQRQAVADAFDGASRGMRSAGFSGPRSVRRIVISGFDPFGLESRAYGEAEATNPSGAAALALDGRTLSSDGVRGMVQGVVMPVSFGAFDAGIVERHFRPYLSGRQQADMIMTISMGASPEFEVEEFAGRSRQAGVPDNPGVTPPRAMAPTGLGAGPQFVRGTLPPSARRVLGRTAPTEQEIEVTEIPAGARRPVRRTSGPTPGSTAVKGSGGGYLSNEIFYRVGRLQLEEGTTVPFGHLHVPLTTPTRAGFADLRDKIVEQVEQILTAVLPDL